MKKILIWLVASLLLTMVGCVEGLQEPDVTETSSEQLPDLTAGFAEGKTKTYVESGKYLRWHEDDRLTAFYGNTRNRQYKFNGATGDNSGSFSYVPSGNLETGNALDRIYAVYPYYETATITDDGKISLTLPAVQTYAENSFGRGANTMLAATENVEDTFLGFKNACGYLKLKFYNADGATIKSIVVKGNGDEKIAGAATATIDFGEAPQLIMADDATTSITLDCGDGVTLGTTAEAATEFWVVIPETTFEGGITITVTDTKGGIFEKSTTKEVVIERNAVQPMAALGVEYKLPSPANNEIWYTNGSTTEATTPNRTDVFGANIISNTYDAEKKCWVIRFNGEVTTIGEHAFNSCENLTSVIIPGSVTSIGDYAFCGCRSLTSITIPDSVTSIGSAAFEDCSSLHEFKGKFVSTDGRCLIMEGVLNCFAPAGITEYTIPDSVTSIGFGAFSCCRSLTSITIPDSVTSIGSYAFYNCSSLTRITIPDSVTSIGNYAFSGCSSLTSITIPDSVTSIGSGAFCHCSSLTSVTIGDSVTSIAPWAFCGCRSLTSITIPDSVTSIGDYAFNGCSSLTSVTIGDSVTSIGSDAFNYCSSLHEFKGKFASTDGRCLIMEGVLNFFAPAGITEYTIPNSVTSIAPWAFHFCSSLTSVTIGDSVTSIAPWAFEDCSSLHEFKGKFASTDGRCLIMEGVLNFFAPAGITEYTIPNSVTSIGDYAFCGCRSLTSITIPDSVTSIGLRAFHLCRSLTSVTIGDSVTSIGSDAFSGCSSLTSITIPDSVTSIGSDAFYGCGSLTSVYCKPTTPPTLDYRVYGYNAGLRIYVPMQSVSKYKGASYWDDYADAIVGYNF